LARAVELKFAPRLHFLADHSFEQAGRIEQLLHQPEIERDLGGDEAKERE